MYAALRVASHVDYRLVIKRVAVNGDCVNVACSDTVITPDAICLSLVSDRVSGSVQCLALCVVYQLCQDNVALAQCSS